MFLLFLDGGSFLYAGLHAALEAVSMLGEAVSTGGPKPAYWYCTVLVIVLLYLRHNVSVAGCNVA